MEKIPKQTYIDPRIKIKKSPTSGQGLFAVDQIKKGELVIRWGGGVIVTNKEFEKGFKKGIYQPESAIHFDEGHKWASLASEPDPEDAAINHSCDPNLWFEKGWPLAARRDIAAGEEITFDYSTGETYQLNSKCKCGAKNCRKFITGKEWRDSEFQKKYQGHFNPYIQKLIDKQTQKI